MNTKRHRLSGSHGTLPSPQSSLQLEQAFPSPQPFGRKEALQANQTLHADVEIETADRVTTPFAAMNTPLQHSAQPPAKFRDRFSASARGLQLRRDIRITPPGELRTAPVRIDPADLAEPISNLRPALV
jgi:hypothetical protein